VLYVAYFDLVRPTTFLLKTGRDAMDTAWFNIKELPDLAFDHTKIVNKAIQRLKTKTTYERICFELFDKNFHSLN
jgi:8-oxo-dGTP diphosphatase